MCISKGNFTGAETRKTQNVKCCLMGILQRLDLFIYYFWKNEKDKKK